MKGIVLTGGPGSGKTVVTNILAQANPERFVLVPEAATQVYAAARTRWDLVDVAGRRDLQRRIYLLQREQEERTASRHPDKILILDRGTVDGAAYWPDGPDAYWAEMGTTLEAELARYDHAIWMQTAAAIGIYDGSDSNSCRFEDPAGAIRSGELLARLWAGHKNLLKIAAFPRLDDKIAAVQKILDAIAG
ncbi:MAG TPA: ATP-binding protein [Tepidisphaeraceae bacterium]|jgi:predicted ATPase|nr:ATP-binding protein [Tepidisphaeraceae bacterium]